VQREKKNTEKDRDREGGRERERSGGELGMVAHTYNPSYSGGIEVGGSWSKASLGQKEQDCMGKIN
jgi:hypothetical protein